MSNVSTDCGKSNWTRTDTWHLRLHQEMKVEATVNERNIETTELFQYWSGNGNVIGNLYKFCREINRLGKKGMKWKKKKLGLAMRGKGIEFMGGRL